MKRTYTCRLCGGLGHQARTCGRDYSPRLSLSKKRGTACTSPRHAYKCSRCGLLTSGKESADGRVFAYDKAGDCLTCTQPRPGLCPDPCITEGATP
jgi:hypothetical protein